MSTDFVFNGSQGSPYQPEQAHDPLGGSGRGVILRTSWVMGPVGKNFALTMLQLHREHMQIGTGAMREQRVGATWPSTSCRLSGPAIPCWIAPAAGGCGMKTAIKLARSASQIS